MISQFINLDDINKYIDVLVQAPLAVILMAFIIIMFKLHLNFMNKSFTQQNKILEAQQKMLNELTEVIKILRK